HPQIAHERDDARPPILVRWSTEQRRWVHRDHYTGRERRFEPPAAGCPDPQRRPEERLAGRSAQANEHAWLEKREFRFQPGKAGPDFTGVRFAVDPEFAPRLPFE